MEEMKRGRDVAGGDDRQKIVRSGRLKYESARGGAIEAGKVRKLETQEAVSRGWTVAKFSWFPEGRISAPT